jgi:hypothetical protein
VLDRAGQSLELFLVKEGIRAPCAPPRVTPDASCDRPSRPSARVPNRRSQRRYRPSATAYRLRATGARKLVELPVPGRRIRHSKTGVDRAAWRIH